MSTRKSTPKRKVNSSKNRLLRSAIGLFSNKGFDGVSVNEIVKKAKVNKRMVYHFFSNKALLYQETLVHAYGGLSAFEQKTIGDAQTLEDVVKRLVKVYFEFPRIHPEFTRLMLWENLHKGQGIRGSKTRLTKESVVTRLDEAIKREAEGVTWRRDLDATQLLITIIGICQLYASHRYTLSQGLNYNLGSTTAIKQGKATAEHFLFAGMRA